MQQATVNLLADMGAQPATVISGLNTAGSSTDTTAPTSTITSPAAGAAVADGTRLTVQRHGHSGRRFGRGRRRGVDRRRRDLAPDHHAERRGQHHVDLLVGRPRQPVDHHCDRAPSTTTATSRRRPRARSSTSAARARSGAPTSPPGTSTRTTVNAIELGVKFTSDVAGSISGIRFYKATANTGTHIGNLWTSSGTLLGHRDLHGGDGERLAAGRLLQPGRRSRRTPPTSRRYYAPKGHYSADSRPTSTVHRAPGSVPGASPTRRRCTRSAARPRAATGSTGTASSSTFPTQTFNGENYWVDVSFAPSAAATAPAQADRRGGDGP